jgi:hypothetical protein
MRFLAIDPGVTTGYAIAQKDMNRMFIAVGQEKLDHYEFNYFLRNTLAPWEQYTVICEDFKFRQNKQQNKIVLYPVELIGILRLFMYGDEDNLYMQEAWIQGDKAQFSDERLKELDLYPKGLQHGRSALKHLLYWWEFSAGYKYNDRPIMELVEEQWLRDAYDVKR